MKAYELDENGFYVSDIPFFDEERAPLFYTLVPLTQSFFKPKFDGAKWVEGDTRENHIGKTVYSITDKTPMIIKELGPIPVGYTEQVPREFDKWDGSLWITNQEIRLNVLKQRKLVEINTDLENALAALRQEYPESEIMTWVKQEDEARRFKDDPSYPTPLIDLIAEARGIPKNDLINKVIQKSEQYAFAVGMAIGRRQYLEDLVKNIVAGQETELGQIKF